MINSARSKVEYSRIKKNKHTVGVRNAKKNMRIQCFSCNDEKKMNVDTEQAIHQKVMDGLDLLYKEEWFRQTMIDLSKT